VRTASNKDMRRQMKATELNHDCINRWFRFSHDGFERFGRLTSIEFSEAAYVKNGPVKINVRWKTTDDLTGYAHGIKPEAKFVELDPPAPEADEDDVA
jgi:hypothetical protein